MSAGMVLIGLRLFKINPRGVIDKEIKEEILSADQRRNRKTIQLNH